MGYDHRWRGKIGLSSSRLPLVPPRRPFAEKALVSRHIEYLDPTRFRHPHDLECVGLRLASLRQMNEHSVYEGRTPEQHGCLHGPVQGGRVSATRRGPPVQRSPGHLPFANLAPACGRRRPTSRDRSGRAGDPRPGLAPYPQFGSCPHASIDKMVQEALTDGATQLVLLGAGYDSRAYRLPLAHDVTVFEVDHPSTQRAKRARLDVSGASVEHVRFVGVDFELDDVAGRLADAGFDKKTRSILVWEGVISYLSASAVDENFELLSGICSPGSRLIFTYVDGRALDGSMDFEEARRWKGWVRLNGEPFVFGFHPDQLASYLSERGFRLDSDRSTAEVARGYRTELGRVEQGSDLYRVAEATRTNKCQR